MIFICCWFLFVVFFFSVVCYHKVGSNNVLVHPAGSIVYTLTHHEDEMLAYFLYVGIYTN